MKMVYKTIEELRPMTLEEIAAYQIDLGEKIHSGKYSYKEEFNILGWLENVLITVLEEKLGENYEGEWLRILSTVDEEIELRKWLIGKRLEDLREFKGLVEGIYIGAVFVSDDFISLMTAPECTDFIVTVENGVIVDAKED